MSKVISHIRYTDTALPTGSTTVTLFSLGANVPGTGALALQGAGVLKFALRLRNSQAGTLTVKKSDDNITFSTVHTQTMDASPTNDVNRFAIAVDGYKFLKVEWANGGVTQTTFDPMMTLVEEPLVSGQYQESSARLRGPVVDATNNFAYQAGLTHQVFTIPAAWLGRRVDVSVVGSALTAAGLPPTVWLLFGTSSGMQVDRSAFVTGTPPAFTGSAVIGRPIAHGETRDYFVDPNWTHFSVEADTAATAVYIFLSDYPPQIVS